jgi:hypothetical protein
MASVVLYLIVDGQRFRLRPRTQSHIAHCYSNVLRYKHRLGEMLGTLRSCFNQGEDGVDLSGISIAWALKVGNHIRWIHNR